MTDEGCVMCNEQHDVYWIQVPIDVARYRITTKIVNIYLFIVDQLVSNFISRRYGGTVLNTYVRHWSELCRTYPD